MKIEEEEERAEVKEVAEGKQAEAVAVVEER